jgi:hypothetical protein
MRVEPALFEVTHWMRDVFHQLRPHIVDNFLLRGLNIKLLVFWVLPGGLVAISGQFLLSSLEVDVVCLLLQIQKGI